jgi:hypothetical protein
MDGPGMRTDVSRNKKNVYQANLHYKLSKGRPKARRKYAQNDVRKMGIVNWRKVAQERDGWRIENVEVLVLFG